MGIGHGCAGAHCVWRIYIHLFNWAAQPNIFNGVVKTYITRQFPQPALLKMSPPSSAAKAPGAAAAADSSCWQFSWEAQSHASILRLLIFKANTKPSAQCRDLKLSFHPQKSLLTVSFRGGEGQIETSVGVPVPRVLIDQESPLKFRVFDDHIEVKLVLLLPVDHPLVSNFDSILNVEENNDELRTLSVDSGNLKFSNLFVTLCLGQNFEFSSLSI